MKKLLRKLNGVTLVELTITAVLLSAMALVIMGPFRYLATSTQRSKEGTLANNLAQEKIEILKNKSYQAAEKPLWRGYPNDFVVDKLDSSHTLFDGGSLR